MDRYARLSACLPAILALAATVPAAAEGSGEVAKIEAVLDDFHAAASDADEERYFSHLAESGVFLGTDATERWTKQEFRAYAHPHFSQGKGWTYRSTVRHVALAEDGRTAWFDELLANAKYGECRGSGILQRYGGAWKIEQYHLTIPIPNDLAADFVARIRAHASGESGGS